MKSLKPTFPALALCVLSCVCPALPARADLTLVTHMSMDDPSLHVADKQKAAELKAMMDQRSNTTIYISGHKMRTENSLVTTISDSDTQKILMLNPEEHRYTVTSPTPEEFKTRVLRNLKIPHASDKNVTYNVTDTGKTTTILGHLARHYILTAKWQQQGVAISATADVLATPDLLGPDNDQLAGAMPEIKGYPLAMTVKVKGTPEGDATIKITVTSISTDPIPASKFIVPADYTENKQDGPW